MVCYIAVNEILDGRSFAELALIASRVFALVDALPKRGGFGPRIPHIPSWKLAKGEAAFDAVRVIVQEKRTAALGIAFCRCIDTAAEAFRLVIIIEQRLGRPWRAPALRG
jgi:hypothetical protein